MHVLAVVLSWGLRSSSIDLALFHNRSTASNESDPDFQLPSKLYAVGIIAWLATLAISETVDRAPASNSGPRPRRLPRLHRAGHSHRTSGEAPANGLPDPEKPHLFRAGSKSARCLSYSVPDPKWPLRLQISAVSKTVHLAAACQLSYHVINLAPRDVDDDPREQHMKRDYSRKYLCLNGASKSGSTYIHAIQQAEVTPMRRMC
jgi:hypothetical protein